MAELPEIKKFSSQMNTLLAGKTLQRLELSQPKCTNVPLEELEQRTKGQKIKGVASKGKWMLISLTGPDTLLLSLGMGADLLYYEPGAQKPEKYQVDMQLAGGDGVTARFWWFGNLLIWPTADLAQEKNTGKIAIDPFDPAFTPEYFRSLCKTKKCAVKTFLLDQKCIGGIGNMYVHDILFRARLHPQKKLNLLAGADVDKLYNAIEETLGLSRELGAFSYEKDLFGQPGGFSMEQFLVGYKKEQPCPVCGAAIEQIKTGSTTSFICPVCQKL